ncbi:MAG: hypothetical protein PVI82_02740 [Desulfobacterales bacterium]|jgi:hypothetical protein
MEKPRTITDLKVKRIENFFAEQKKLIMIAKQRPRRIKYTVMLVEFSGDYFSSIDEIIRDELDRTLMAYEPVYNYKNVLLTNPKGGIFCVLNHSFLLRSRFKNDRNPLTA